MEGRETMDDRYTTGIWYDASAGDFCKLDRGDDNVLLLHPETGDIYHEIPYDNWPYAKADFHEVPEHVVEDPESYIENWMYDQIVRGEVDVGLMFADRNTKIVETDDHSYIVD